MIDIQEMINEGKTGRHETFAPRYGWLKKGYDKCLSNPHVFNDEDSIEQLGVGKNMVRSIRFWCLVFRLLKTPEIESEYPKGSLVPDKLGSRLLDNQKGWDPYLEDPASFWLLHWQMFIPPFSAVSWPLAFNFCNLHLFNHKQFASTVKEAARKYPKLSSLSPRSFERDASCIIRMYAPSYQLRSEIKCPFESISLFNTGIDEDSYSFALGDKPNLPSLVFLAACFSYSYYTQPNVRTLSLNSIVYGFNAPGVVFKMSETDCGAKLEQAIGFFSKVDFMESVGLRQLQFSDPPEQLYWECLEKYFERENGTI